MALPLYRQATSVRPQLGTTAHAGLWYEKFCDKWSESWSLSGDGGGKLDWIGTVTGKRLGIDSRLTEAARRLCRLTLARNGIVGIFVTEHRFVTGLGRSHPIENGFAWHPTLGVPYLPGSSVKGLVRAWAERDADPRPALSRVSEIFGSQGRAGRIALLDAIPIPPVQLEADVITPHYAQWTPDDPPGDWRSPVPIPFLVVAPGRAFAFSVVPVRANEEKHAVEDAWAWLREALDVAGAGAKTSVGYGRFRFDTTETDKWRNQLELERAAEAELRRRAEARRSPEGRWRLECEGKSERDLLELVPINLEKEPLADPVERRAFAAAVIATGFPAFWRKGDKRERETGVGEKKLRDRARLLQDALGEH